MSGGCSLALTPHQGVLPGLGLNLPVWKEPFFFLERLLVISPGWVSAGVPRSLQSPETLMNSQPPRSGSVSCFYQQHPWAWPQLFHCFFRNNQSLSILWLFGRLYWKSRGAEDGTLWISTVSLIHLSHWFSPQMVHFHQEHHQASSSRPSPSQQRHSCPAPSCARISPPSHTCLLIHAYSTSDLRLQTGLYHSSANKLPKCTCPCSTISSRAPPPTNNGF